MFQIYSFDNKNITDSPGTKLDLYEEDDEDDDFDDLDFDHSDETTSQPFPSDNSANIINDNFNMGSSSTADHQPSNSIDQPAPISEGMRNVSLREDPFQDLLEDSEVDEERER